MDRRQFLQVAAYGAGALTLLPVWAGVEHGVTNKEGVQRAWSTRPLFRDFQGAIATYRRASDDAELTVFHDTPAEELEAWSHGETDIFVVTLFDQGGSGQDLVYQGATHQPTVTKS